LKIAAIIGARPQFIKHYPFELACRGKLELITIHTGQHFDENMSSVFFDQLGMSKPDYLLQLGGGGHGAQTGKMMEEIEKIFVIEKPDAVVVYGDTNSTLAGALVASKMGIKIAHIEAGLRSYNRAMPEEINRVLTDHISEWLFTPSDVSKTNLAKEGIVKNVYVIGDIMKDLIIYTSANNLIKKPSYDFPYYYITLHRPYNVDEKDRLTKVLDTLNNLDKKAIFAIHPRTRNAFKQFGLYENDFANIKFIDPQPYFENIGYIAYSEALITDSGGMQKEAYWLSKKCITVRSETEWVETLEGNANVLVFHNLNAINLHLQNDKTVFDPSLYGEGKSCSLIVDILQKSSTKNQ
jgi:UDP-GlcNAc3NAcA epimerase